ncbi:MAG: hypothetical protein Q8Q12_13160 [bacterium]|nr:hypothetical protein [bacterium]
MMRIPLCLLSVMLLIITTMASSSETRGTATPDADTPSAILRDAALVRFRGANSPSPEQPGDTDCNSPAHWDGETLYVFNSAGHPWRSAGPDLFRLGQSPGGQGYIRAEYNNKVNGGRWIESTHKDDDGTLYGWYHNEPGGLVPGTGLTAPKIGALRSKNNGMNWEDLGIVLEARPGTLRPDTPNKYFAGGNGDFSVILDREKKYFYFFISTYWGATSDQGVAAARMLYKDRNEPVGKVWKWHKGEWSEPGIGGYVTPIFPAKTDWHREDVDAFWGASIHWNTHLGQYVILLNRAIDKNWKQEGVYVSFNRDLSNPTGWTPPKKILGGLRADGWYPQVIGLSKENRETDKLAGKAARLFVRGESRWEIVFMKLGEPQMP